MSPSNSYNSLNGRQFQNSVQAIFNNLFNTSFEQEVAIPIGTPPKDHKFDLANSDRSAVVECKNYRWTKSGNVPSAKLTGLDEAVFYFNFLPKEHTKKILCIKECIHQEKQETLAHYFVRMHGHLLGDVCVFEISNNGDVYSYELSKDGNVLKKEKDFKVAESLYIQTVGCLPLITNPDYILGW